MAPIRLAVVGLGKIARDQHLPAIAANPDFALAATASRSPEGAGDTPHFGSLAELLARGPSVDAVVLCTPPQVRTPLAAEAIAAGKHVFLEKPPGATVSEVLALDEQAGAAGVTLFASWHSRHAAGVAAAKAWLATRRIERVEIVWREDVRHWHPGQAWIWEPGGLGVFDPGINALSIVTEILPRRIFLTAAELSTPQNRAAPIAADLKFQDTAGAPVTMDLDWRQTGPQTWDIRVQTTDGACVLSSGGSVLTLPTGEERHPEAEYPGLYARFAHLVRRGASDVDVAPLQLVADAFMLGRQRLVEAFED